jgi:hypothetical protein
MEKTRYLFENQAFGLWPKASDYETAMDLGWLLYSTRYQDEESLSDLFSQLTRECIQVSNRKLLRHQLDQTGIRIQTMIP